MSKDTIYREDAIKAINLKARIPHDIASAQYAQMAINAICSVPSADRPSGEVDAVKEYEHHAHNLNQGYITLGEFDKRIEPLRHLHYDRPQGWIPCSERLPARAGHYLCSFKKPNRIDNIYVDLAYWTGGRWYGYLANEINAWTPLPEPWKGADNE